MPELFQAAGFTPETTFTDYERRGSAGVEPVVDELVIPVSVDDLVASDALADTGDVSWERGRQVLESRAGVLEGAAIATPVAIDAYLLYRRAPGGGIDVLAASCREVASAEVYLALLLRWLIGRSDVVRLPRLAAGEVPQAVLAALSFEAVRRHARYAATARRA